MLSNGAAVEVSKRRLWSFFLREGVKFMWEREI